MLSEESRSHRQKTNSVNIRISFITWLLEFLTGLTWVFSPWLSNDISKIVMRSIDAYLCSVIIPLVYMMNTEGTKQAIVTQSWYRGIRAAMGMNGSVVPAVANNPPSVEDAPIQPQNHPEEDHQPQAAVDGQEPPIQLQNHPDVDAQPEVIVDGADLEIQLQNHPELDHQPQIGVRGKDQPVPPQNHAEIDGQSHDAVDEDDNHEIRPDKSTYHRHQ